MPTATISRCGGSGGGGTDLQDVILVAGANALWKFDEGLGTVAHDSSGNGFDLAAAPNPGSWGNSAGPPATPTAGFVDPATERFALGTYQALGAAAAPFSVFGWANYTDMNPADGYWIVGQGTSAGVGFGQGWGLVVIHDTTHPGQNRLTLYSNNGTFADPLRIRSDNPVVQGTWYFYAVTWNGTTWRIYVDALVQAATDNRAWTPQVGINIASMDGVSVPFHFAGLLSWWAAVPGIALSSTQLLTIMNAVP
jgi:hypothetical protein